MRKLFIAFILIFMCFGAFSETLEGTWGFKFGMNKDEVLELCESKGFDVWYSNDTIIKAHVPESIKYADIELTDCEIQLFNGKMWEIDLITIKPKAQIQSNIYVCLDNLMKGLKAKYNMKNVGDAFCEEFILFYPDIKGLKVHMIFNFRKNSKLTITFSNESYKVSDDI